MAGYSGTPLVKKLGIKEGSRVALVGTPDGFMATLGRLPVATTIAALGEGELDVVVLFCLTLRTLEREFGAAARGLAPAGGLWVAWPKKASGLATDLNGDIVREFGLAAGLVDNKVCAIDDTWSGLRFVYRLRDRPGRN